MAESEGKEAEQVPDSMCPADLSSASDREDFIEPTPEEIKNALLVAGDQIEEINYDDLLNEDYDTHPSGVIHAIVRSGSHDGQASSSDQTEASTEDSSEDQNEIPKELSKALSEVVVKELSVHEEEVEEDEYGKGSLWRHEKKHIFILSSSGKPVYSRHGNEDKIVTIMGVMQALVSFVSASKDSIRSIVAGDHRFVFFIREHLYLVAVSKGSESMQQLLLQLSYIYNQILSVLTVTSLQKIFKQRRNYDLRRMLSGSEKFIDNLLNLMDHDPSFKLQAVRCLPLDSQVRDSIAQAIIQHARVKDLVFAIILANNQLVTLVRMKKYYLHPMDLHLIINLVNASESFKAAESWTPICLPKFDASGFLQAHISYLDENCQTCMLLLSVDRESFFTLSECKKRVQDRLIKYNGLQAISDSLMKTSYSCRQCGISDLRHFLYKSRSMAQYTSPELEAPYLSEAEQERLFGLYLYLHNRIHTSVRSLKILYHVGKHETLLGWVTQQFELYAVFGPLITKHTAIGAINKLLRWIKKEETRLFILNSATF